MFMPSMKCALVLTLLAIFALPAQAQFLRAPGEPGYVPYYEPSIPSELPQIQQAGSISYVTGGIGDGERLALESVAKDYNLHITSADQAGAFVADTQLILSDQQGNTLLTVQADPLFYAKLPAGQYSLKASNGAETKDVSFNVSADSSKKITLSWKQDRQQMSSLNN